MLCTIYTAYFNVSIIYTSLYKVNNVPLVSYVQGGPKKPGPVWALITQRWLVVESCVIRQKFQNAVKN